MTLFMYITIREVCVYLADCCIVVLIAHRAHRKTIVTLVYKIIVTCRVVEEEALAIGGPVTVTYPVMPALKFVT